MGRPYSLDLRERVVSAVRSGVSCRKAAAQFHVGVSTAIRWTKREQETGSPAALAMGGKRRSVLEKELPWLLARLEAKPDLTLRGILQELHERGIKVSYFAVWTIMHRAGKSFKKKPSRQRAGSPRRRAQAQFLDAAPA